MHRSTCLAMLARLVRILARLAVTNGIRKVALENFLELKVGELVEDEL